MKVIGVDVGVLLSHVATIELGDPPKVTNVATIKTADPREIDVSHIDLTDVAAVFIERPAQRFFGRANAATVLKVAARAGDVMLGFQRLGSGCSLVFVDYDEWSERILPVTRTRADIDRFFIEVFGARLYNEHIRDAAVMALKAARRYGVA